MFSMIETTTHIKLHLPLLQKVGANKENPVLLLYRI